MNYGFLLFDKPTGITSFGALHQIDKHFSLERHGQKLGHGGTLDPEASGLMVSAVGRATKLLRFVQGSDKNYIAQFHLGQRTSTDDATGEVIQQAPFNHITREQIENALNNFRGTIQQVPPDFSALHINGKRAYDLARKGKSIELPPRQITIYSNVLTSCNLPDDPFISLEISCSGGTYIRSIARDLGEKLGCHAHMSALRRTLSCHFDIKDAPTLDTILNASSLDPFLIPCERALAHYPVIKLSPAQTADLMQGKFVDLRNHDAGIYRIQTDDNPTLQAVVEVTHETHKIEITRINT